MAGTAWTVMVSIPWVPPSNMLPNRVTSTRTLGDRRRALRRDAVRMLRSELVGMGLVPEQGQAIFRGQTNCRITISWGKEMTRGKKATGMVRWRQQADPDNLLSACKGLIDSLQDVDLIDNDRNLIHAPIEQVRDPVGRGYTTIELWQGVE